MRRNRTEYGFRRERRATATRDPKPLLLIVCEGGKTEPRYFQAFRVSTLTVKVVGTGHHTVSPIEKAKDISHGLDPEPDQVWCVFDKNSFDDSSFREAIRRAKTLGFRVAYSNEASELWYLLHFDYHDAALLDSVGSRHSRWIGPAHEAGRVQPPMSEAGPETRDHDAT